MKKNYYENLTTNRRNFVDQLYNLIHSEFQEQWEENPKGEDLIKEN